MLRKSFIRRPEHYGKDISACGVIGFIHHDKKRVDGSVIRKSMANMHDRGNGLGGGFAAYGIYPEMADKYALHIMYDTKDDAPEVEKYLESKLDIYKVEPISIFEVPAIPSYPYFKRYFVLPPKDRFPPISDNDYMVNVVMHINVNIEHAFVVSSGKNMGVFKGVGFPEDIADFFRLDEYDGYIWTGHNRFPTNTPGWWGGAHPFALLDWSIVHNGEISSYGTNRRYLEMFGYQCTLQTDTEVVAYLMDLLVRRHELSFEHAAAVFAPPFWKDIDQMPDAQKNFYTKLRMIYSAAALNGPFAFLMGYSEGLIGLNDRVKLRPLVVATHDKTTYMASEEAAIREICPEVDRLWAPRAGRPIIAKMNEEPVSLSVE
ncbi:MAG: glutamine amidotransferase family protein [Phycisphaerae bacterium]